MDIYQKVKNFFVLAGEVQKEKAVGVLEWECGELTNIFALLVLGSFVGIPAPPAHVTFELMPLMEEEMKVMLAKVGTANDPMAELFSVLEPC